MLRLLRRSVGSLTALAESQTTYNCRCAFAAFRFAALTRYLLHALRSTTIGTLLAYRKYSAAMAVEVSVAEAASREPEPRGGITAAAGWVQSKAHVGERSEH